MERVWIHIRGIVQGVGFRPFIHKQVQSRGLRGYIENTSSGVELELEGERAELERFVRELPEKAPVLAVIDGIETVYSKELRRPHGGKAAHAFKPGYLHLRRLPAGTSGPEGPALPLSLYQLHQLRPALYDYPGSALRPAADLDGALPDVPGLRAGVSRH